MNGSLRTRRLVAIATGTALAAVLALPAVAEDPVTYERILNSEDEPGNWLTHNQRYSGIRFSELEEINKENVGDLKFAFATALQFMTKKADGGDGEVEATPLANDGFLYFTDGWGRVYKVDATGGNGRIVWKMDPAVSPDYPWGGLHHRGVALLDDKVYSVALDGRLIASDWQTGEVVWEENFQTAPGEYFTVAPLALDGKIVWGAAGGETGSRDWLMANDAETGEQIWKTYTIPGPGEPGHETWGGDFEAWRTGGGSIWVTGVYDPDQNLTIWGIGNPQPDVDPEFRPGDNLYTNSALALNADSGQIEWYFQYTPNDAWDYDEVGSHLLVDLEVAGETRQTVLHAARNGFFYALDRTNGQFIHSGQYVDEVNWTAGLDPKTGLPVEYDPNLEVQTYVPEHRPSRSNPEAQVCPRLNGGTNWFPTSYSERTGLVYGSAIEGCGVLTNQNVAELVESGELEPGGRWFGGGSESLETSGSVYAIDPTTGETVVKHEDQFANISGVLSTAGGLVFNGTLDGDFRALDDETLEVLWSVNVGTMMEAPAISYEVDGKQYIAVLAGGRDARRGYYEDGGSPELAETMEQSYNLWVFTL